MLGNSMLTETTRTREDLSEKNRPRTDAFLSPLYTETCKDLEEDWLELSTLTGGLVRKLREFLDDSRPLILARRRPPLAVQHALDIKHRLDELHEELLTARAETARGPSANDLERLSSMREYFFSELRECYRVASSIICAFEWQSPTFAHGVQPRTGRHQARVFEHAFDYKRDRHLDAELFEEEFLANYPGLRDRTQARAYLANSGMGAMSTVLNYLRIEKGIQGPALACASLYFENKHLVAKSFRHTLAEVSDPSAGAFIEAIQRVKPKVIFLESLCNEYELRCPDVVGVLKYLYRDYRQEVTIVLDATCTPAFFEHRPELTAPPKHVSLFVVESLAKYYQYGMDIVTGGVIVQLGDFVERNDFWRTRAKLGTNIADASVYAIPRPNRRQFRRRLKRLERNATYLAASLQALVAEGKLPLLDRIVYPKLSQHPCYSWVEERPFNGSILNLSFQKRYRTVSFYKLFESRCMEIAKEQQIDVSCSTSFGFNTTRLYITAPNTEHGEPFLRISVGTETRFELELVQELLVQTLITLGREVEAGLLSEDIFTVDSARPVAESKECSSCALYGTSVYRGSCAVLDLLDPAKTPPTPLVELPPELNPLANENVRVFGKLLSHTPLLNVKAIPAFNMLSEAREKGELDGVNRLVESSSMSTALSLSVIARAMGIPTIEALVDHTTSSDLIRMLQLFGIRPLLHPYVADPEQSAIPTRVQQAKCYALEPDVFHAGQYSNPANPAAHEKWTGPQIWQQMEGRLSVFCAGLGTTGTFLGTSRYLRSQNPAITCLGVARASGEHVPGPRTISLLADVEFPWNTELNRLEEVTGKEAYRMSVELIRHGFIVGPSSGMSLVGLLKYLTEQQELGLLDSLRDRSGEVSAVFICCDTPFPHLNRYFEQLGPEYFPAIGATETYLQSDTARVAA